MTRTFDRRSRRRATEEKRRPRRNDEKRRRRAFGPVLEVSLARSRASAGERRRSRSDLEGDDGT